jgi:glycosyltransferase involved in cell wall biosynthesis
MNGKLLVISSASPLILSPSKDGRRVYQRPAKELMAQSSEVSAKRIVINTIPLQGSLTGVGHYVSQLVRQFRLLDEHNEYTYYYGFFSKNLVGPDHPIQRLRNQLPKTPWFRKTLRQAVFFLSGLFHSEFDLYFEPNFIPVKIRARKIVTTVHDFSFRLFPEAHPKDRIHYFEKHFSKSIRRSNRIITDSVYIKSEATELLGLPDEMITPVHLGVDHDVFKIYQKEALESCKREFSLPERFILFVGTREPRKNLDRLVWAYAELPEQIRREFGLVLVGPQGWGVGDRLVREKLGDRVTILNYVQTYKLAQIYNLASMFVYPSLYEGFGLPPLEAMACGCPVIASRAASLPEVCGDAAYYVDPKDVHSIAEGMYKVLADDQLGRSLTEKGKERAKLFTWERTAKETLKILGDVLNATG